MQTYLINLSLTWIVLLLIYKLFLEKEKFFTINRFYLLASLVIGLLLPFVEYIELSSSASLAEVIPQVNEVYQTQLVALESWSSPTLDIQESIAAPSVETSKIDWSWSSVLLAFYFIGVLIVLIKSIKSILSLASIIKNAKVYKFDTHNEIIATSNLLPFSFFKYVFIGGDKYSLEEKQNILKHELHHIQHRHSLDIVFIQVLKLFFWWNPIVYIYHRAITENHEYSADAAVIADTSRKQYCSMLLQSTFPDVNLELTNPFFQTYIKKRITMMYRSQSKKTNTLKYGISIIALGVLCVLFIKPVSAQDNNKVEEPIVYEAQDDLEWTSVDKVIDVDKDVEGEFPKKIIVSQKGELYNEGIDYAYNHGTGKLYLAKDAFEEDTPVNVNFIGDPNPGPTNFVQGLISKLEKTERYNEIIERNKLHSKLQPGPIRDLSDAASITKYAELTATAKAENKYIFLNFGAVWCSPCKQMKEETFNDKVIVDLLAAHFVVKHLDIDESTGHSFKQKFDVKYLPTMIIMDAEGQVYERIEELKTSSELKAILERYSNKQETDQQEKFYTAGHPDCIKNDQGVYYRTQSPVKLPDCPTGMDSRDHISKVLKEYGDQNFVMTDEAIKEGFIGSIYTKLVIDETGRIERYIESANMPIKHGMKQTLSDMVDEMKAKFQFEPAKCEGQKVKSQVSFIIPTAIPEDKKHLISVKNASTVVPEQTVTIHSFGKYKGVGMVTFQYRSNMNVPTTISIENPEGELIYEKEYETMYVKIYNSADILKELNGKYKITATQDGRSVSSIVDCTIF